MKQGRLKAITIQHFAILEILKFLTNINSHFWVLQYFNSYCISERLILVREISKYNETEARNLSKTRLEHKIYQYLTTMQNG